MVSPLVQAVIQAESAGNPNAVSPVGALGLMQVMPATARDPGFGVSPVDPSKLFDPAVNVQFGTQYLNAMLNRYGGDRDAALVAYNAGPGVADRFVAAGKDPSTIPAETRTYVQRVNQLLGEPTSQPTQTAQQHQQPQQQPQGLLSGGQQEMANGNGIQGLLSGALNNPLTELGIGILAASAPGTSLGQAIGGGFQFASQREQDRLKNELIRAKLGEEQQRRQATQQLQQRLPGLLGDSVTPQQQEMIGLLAQAAPAQVAQGLIGQVFGQERSAPADIRTMQALGIEQTPEGFAEFQRLKGGDVDSLMREVTLRQKDLQNSIAQETIEQKRRERELAEKTEQEKLVDTRNAVNNTVSNVFEMSERLDRISGSILAKPGIGIDDVRRYGLIGIATVGDRFGFDQNEAQSLLTDRNRFNQLASREALSGLEILRGTGAISDTKFNAIQKTIIDPSSDEGSLRLAMADMLEASVQGAEKNGIPVPNRSQVEERIRDLRRPRDAGPSDVGRAVERAGEAATRQIRRIRRMSREQIERLDLGALSTEELQAVVQRLRSVGQ